MKKNSRRDFIKITGSLVVTCSFFNFSDLKILQNNRNRILLRSGWSTDSYSDLAVIPAAYRSIQRFVPNTEVMVWPFTMNEILNSLLENNFTNINLINGTINDQGEPTTEELKKAFDSAHMLMYVTCPNKNIDWAGTDPSAIETASIEYCIKNNIPYILYGIGDIPEATETQSAMQNKLNKAILTFIMDSTTEDILKDNKIKNLQLAPPIIFGFDLKNDNDARKYISDLGLSNKTFIVVNLYSNGNNIPQKNTAINKIVYLIENWIQKTEHFILLIPEKSADVEILSNVYNQLSNTAKEKTKLITEDISPDMVSSIVEKSRIATGMSPYLLFSAMQVGIPIYHYSDWSVSNSGQSLIDLGLKDFVIDIEKVSENEFVDKLSEIDDKYVKALIETNKSNEDTNEKLQRSFDDIYRQLLKINPITKEKKKKKDK